IGEVDVRPGATDVRADVEAGPAEHWNRWRCGRRLQRKISRHSRNRGERRGTNAYQQARSHDVSLHPWSDSCLTRMSGILSPVTLDNCAVQATLVKKAHKSNVDLL